MDQKINSCPEFPFFGASYPDATCIDGYLWDLDKCDNERMLYGGGEEPCPFCNSQAFIEWNDNGEPGDREAWSNWVNLLHIKHNYIKSKTDGDSTAT